MKKATSKVLVFTALVAITLAPTKGDPLPTPQTGFYVGVALGGADLTVKSSLFLNWLAGVIPSTQNFHSTITNKDIAGDIFLGYGKRINNCLSLEGEATVSFAPLTSNIKLGITTANPQSLEIKTISAMGGALRLGYYINTTNKLYLKMGFESRHFKVNFTDPSNTFANLNKSYNSTAFVPGLGMEVDLTPRFSLRMEYRVAFHPKKTVHVANSATQSTSVQTKPTIHYLNLGLIFKM